MILIKNLSSEVPFQIFYKKYKHAHECGQKHIEAACVSSYSKRNNEVNSRFVNIKYLIKKELIFFSNYESIKAEEFAEHSQVSATFFWNEINTQVRIKAHVEKTSYSFNQEHFSKRNKEKNALSISSYQSKEIDSYDEVLNNYNKIFKSNDLFHCPKYWGGYSLLPYCFEFWVGNNSRINKREVYKKHHSKWNHFILQP
jgi:pyridoxamine 5'-phosphate oxidase